MPVAAVLPASLARHCEQHQHTDTQHPSPNHLLTLSHVPHTTRAPSLPSYVPPHSVAETTVSSEALVLVQRAAIQSRHSVGAVKRDLSHFLGNEGTNLKNTHSLHELIHPYS